MKINTRSWSKLFALLAISATTCVATRAGIVYDNTSQLQGQFFNAGVEFGDQITLGGNPQERSVTNFKFEYYLSRAPSGDEKFQLRIYAEGSPPGEPGAQLYDTGVQPLSRTGYNNVELDLAGLTGGTGLDVPNTITWTVQFTGIGGSEQVGLLFENPPAVGSSFDDYWEKSGGVWTVKRFPGGPVANFGALVVALVPEPSTIQYALLAGLMGLGYLGYRRQSTKN
jgi:hypothetical protein